MFRGYAGTLDEYLAEHASEKSAKVFARYEEQLFGILKGGEASAEHEALIKKV